MDLPPLSPIDQNRCGGGAEYKRKKQGKAGHDGGKVA